MPTLGPGCLRRHQIPDAVAAKWQRVEVQVGDEKGRFGGHAFRRGSFDKRFGWGFGGGGHGF